MKKLKKTSRIDLPSLLHLPKSPYEKFHNQTKIKKSSPVLDQSKWPDEWKKIYYKGYARLPETQLLKPQPLKKITLTNVLLTRQSQRTFGKKPISLKAISTLLYYSAGTKNDKRHRFYPSAGARYPLEIYILSLNSQLQNGIYHYYVKSHTLETLHSTDKILYKELFLDKWIHNAGILIVITAVFKRTIVKYSDRGYRYILTEAGHLGQNILLLAEALNLACCPNDSFIDDKLNELLDIDGKDEAVIYTFALGDKINGI